MTLSLIQLIPIPLREKILSASSSVWNKSILIENGACVFVQAPSGSGKTTLIHILYGVRSDYEGIVKWGNAVAKNLDNEQWATLRAKNVSIVFQDMRLFPELTAWENLDVKRQLTATITEQQMDGWLERLGIADKKHDLASTLSFGEQQRVSIIRALVQPFEWLLMDEPFSHLDHANTQKAVALIQEVVAFNNAGMLLADLDENNYFKYTQTMKL